MNQQRLRSARKKRRDQQSPARWMQRAQQANRRGEEPRGASKPDSVVTDPRGAWGGFNVAVETTRPERQGESARKGKANAASRTCEVVTGSSTSVPRAPCGGRARRSRAGLASDPDPRSPADRDTHRHASVRSRLRARRPRGAGAAPGPAHLEPGVSRTPQRAAHAEPRRGPEEGRAACGPADSHRRRAHQGAGRGGGRPPTSELPRAVPGPTPPRELGPFQGTAEETLRDRGTRAESADLTPKV